MSSRSFSCSTLTTFTWHDAQRAGTKWAAGPSGAVLMYSRRCWHAGSHTFSCKPHPDLVVGFRQLAPAHNDVHGVAPAKCVAAHTQREPSLVTRGRDGQRFLPSLTGRWAGMHRDANAQIACKAAKGCMDGMAPWRTCRWGWRNVPSPRHQRCQPCCFCPPAGRWPAAAGPGQTRAPPDPPCAAGACWEGNPVGRQRVWGRGAR